MAAETGGAANLLCLISASFLAVGAQVVIAEGGRPQPSGTGAAAADSSYAGWTTFEDPADGLSFRYPPHYSYTRNPMWVFHGDTTGFRGSTTFCYDPGGDRPSEAVRCDVTLFVFRNPDDLPLDHFVRVIADQFIYDPPQVSQRDTLHLSEGRTAYAYMLTTTSGHAVRLVLLAKRGAVVVLRGHWGGPLFDRGPGAPGDAERLALSSVFPLEWGRSTTPGIGPGRERHGR